MRYKLLGKSGLRVSELAMGGMTLSQTNPWKWGTDKENSLAILKTYAEAGGNFIDTSCNYQDGQSEKVIAEFIKGDRDRYVIATKFTLYSFEQQNNHHKDDPNMGGNARKNMRRSVEESLERLGTDYIDLLYLHMWDYTTPIFEVMRGLNDLISSGKVHYIGISDTPAWIVARANTMAEYNSWDPFVAYQFPYSLSDRDAERDVIPLSRKMDLANVSFQALNEGLFTGKYTRETSEGRLSKVPRDHPHFSKLLDVAREVDNIADELGVLSSSVAIQWVKQQAGVHIPIIGATKKEHMEQNLQHLDFSLKEEHLKTLDTMVREKFGFSYGFPKGWLMGARPHIYANTYDKIDFHRQYE
ncbi:MAG: aldo/keto reductase [Candidatus Heimdallarchaeota archaeon]|nr:aldo/keto reductase [Candidatus Heimdallarchaeota archaeon]